MGAFVQTAIFKNSNEEIVREAIEALENNVNADVVAEDCEYQVVEDSVVVLFNDGVVLEEVDTSNLALSIDSQVLSLYIYDGDFWGYYLADKGAITDKYNAMPEYFEDIDMKEETKRFYSEIWNYELTDEQVTNILEGRVYKEIKGDGVSGV